MSVYFRVSIRSYSAQVQRSWTTTTVCSHTSSSCCTDQQWLDCCGLGKSFGCLAYQHAVYAARPSVRYSFLAQMLVLSSAWFENSRRSFPCVKWTSSRAPSATLYSQSLVFGLNCKARPWEAPTSDPLRSSSAEEAVLPVPLFHQAHTEDGQSRTDSPPLPPEPRSHFPLQPPTAPLSFSISNAIRRRSLSIDVCPWKRKA